MRRFMRMVTGGAALAALSSPALAQNAASASARGSATILQPIAITKGSDLAFGTIVKPSTGSATVTISSANGSRSVTGAAAANETGISRATFTVTGEGGQTYSITVPSSFDMTAGTSTLTVTTTKSIAAGGSLSGSIGSEGSQTLGVGGSFELTSATPTGAYTGSFVVTVSYD